MRTAGTQKLPGATPTENNSRNRENTARTRSADREREAEVDRKGPPKRTAEQGLLVTANDGRDQSRKGGSILGQVQGEGKSPTSSDAKSLKAACPGKQNPCPFGYLNFSWDFHLEFGLWEHISQSPLLRSPAFHSCQHSTPTQLKKTPKGVIAAFAFFLDCFWCMCLLPDHLL